MMRMSRPIVASYTERIWLPDSEKSWRTPRSASAAATRSAPRVLTAPLADEAAGGDGPDYFHLPAADAVQLVHHVADHAAVIRHHVHDLAAPGPLCARREIHDAVLLGKIRDHRLRVLHHVAEPLLAVLVGGQHLRAAVEDGAAVGGPAHHGGPHAHGAVVPR